MTGWTFVLVPGAGGEAWYWHRVVSELNDRGHHAIAVDLPGDDETAGLPEYADAVVVAVNDPGSGVAHSSTAAHGHGDGVVLVAQSLGGFTAPLVCERIPVGMIVLVNAMIPAAGETAGAWWDNTDQAQARQENDVRDGRSPDAEFDLATYFFHDVPQPIADEAIAGARNQSDTPFGDVGLWDAWPYVPTRVLSGRDDRFFPVNFQRRVAQERLGITPDVMPGGHLVALAYPADLASRLEGYASDLG